MLTGGSPPRRKPTKRRVLDSDDGEDGEGVSASSSHSRSKRVRRPSQRVRDSMDAEIDIEGDAIIVGERDENDVCENILLQNKATKTTAIAYGSG